MLMLTYWDAYLFRRFTSLYPFMLNFSILNLKDLLRNSCILLKLVRTRMV